MTDPSAVGDAATGAAGGEGTEPSPGGTAADTSRLETFSDGVIAIAITLLILEVRVPPVVRGANLGRAVLHQWPSYAGYAVSFLTIGVIWVNHHHMFRLIERTNHTFLMANVVFLMAIAFLPWPTALVAGYIRDPDGRTVAAVVYGLTMVAVAVMFCVVWFYASWGGRLLHADVDPATLARTYRSYLLGPVVYGLAVIVALFAPFVSLAIYAGLAVYWLLPGTGPRA
jgi:uncharacterized membrane protein